MRASQACRRVSVSLCMRARVPVYVCRCQCLWVWDQPDVLDKLGFPDVSLLYLHLGETHVRQINNHRDRPPFSMADIAGVSSVETDGPVPTHEAL